MTEAERPLELENSSSPLSRTAEEQAGRLIKTEANFLRFPLFALHTKGLKNLDGIECRGRIRRDTQVREYLLRITRNTASLYPGPLSRRLHFALLSIATERGFPLQNPITWTWRDLCRRIGIAYGGKTTLNQLKSAIRSTHGIVIHTEEALFSRPAQRPLPSLERGYHLYATFAFKNDPLPEGGAADLNAVWFADWYLDNLNALHSAPLDYALWQSLDQRSPIASRLYEFLFFNFHSNSPLLRINYRNLAQLLPIKAETYLSDARKQLEPALGLLQAAGILGEAGWEDGKEGQIQLQFRRGQKLYAGIPKVHRPAPALLTQDGEEVEVRELRNSRPQEWFLVRDFHRLLTGEADSLVQPTPKELNLASELIERHGKTTLGALMPALVKRLKTQWPDAKTFGAAAYYLPEALRDYKRLEHRRTKEKQEQVNEQEERDAITRQAKDQAALKVLWENLSDIDRDAIRRDVLAMQPRSLEKRPQLLERLCLQELARRHSGVRHVAAVPLSTEAAPMDRAATGSPPARRPDQPPAAGG